MIVFHPSATICNGQKRNLLPARPSTAGGSYGYQHLTKTSSYYSQPANASAYPPYAANLTGYPSQPTYLPDNTTTGYHPQPTYPPNAASYQPHSPAYYAPQAEGAAQPWATEMGVDQGQGEFLRDVRLL
ncbi:hypothetical protein B0T26DRAFT_714729 [Lasiosphaeria miniovina]|uniref:Uncharacterized protein n=1 Tax=Lasiosphaeria miniovina TaxID=1954250 RepID=A0AA40AB24_9PEZI|nr:uncharacterized protein B0T26DRAFT_714729 [Lasiosphaeria miniovina]KAK0712598.1 hypothetical protein B0T26DRAFT_714729 [Lasiosphaeria miniovina]